MIPIGVRVGGRPLTAGCTLNVGEGGALLICSEDLPIGTEMQVTNLKSDEFFTVPRRAARRLPRVRPVRPRRRDPEPGPARRPTCVSAAERHRKKRH